MDYEKKNKRLIKNNYNYNLLVELGIPSFILEDIRKWIFFLQEGWNGDINWYYSKEMTQIQQIKFYRFIKTNELDSNLSDEISLKLKLKDKKQFEIKEVKREEGKISFDFFIEGKQLSNRLGIERFDWAYCDFDLDTWTVDHINFSNFNRKELNKKTASVLLGETKPFNQFGTERIVLYRCHCGCDYCGVISFELSILPDKIIWKDIEYEHDDLEEIKNIAIKELRFDKREYQFVLNEYLNNYCA